MTVRGFASHENTAPLSQRYKGLYHYSGYRQEWDKIIDVGRHTWIVRAVNVRGEFIGPERSHMTPMHADMFANKPFAVKAKDLERCRG